MSHGLNPHVIISAEVFTRLQGLLLGGAFSLMVIATAAVCLPQQTQPMMPSQTVDDFKIHTLEETVKGMASYEIRIVKLEDAVAAISQDSQEAKWWYRGIGCALLLAIMERILRTAGVLPKDKTDGQGPVG